MKSENMRTVILAAIEPSPASDQVIHTAASMSRIVPGAELHFLHVVDAGAPPHETAISMTDLVDEGRKYVDGAVRQAMDASDARVSAHLALGKPAERILQVAADLSADLIIVGSHGKKGLSRIVGSVSQKVLAHASCQVLLARVKEQAPTAPEIEPPCPACIEVQRATNGEKLWCVQHATRHVHGHLHYEVSEGFGGGSMFVRPQN
jgi:nucleotide-binding universal stress UspA family protein